MPILSNFPDGGLIDTIKKNGVVQPIVDRAVNIEVPTSLSALTPFATNDKFLHSNATTGDLEWISIDASERVVQTITGSQTLFTVTHNLGTYDVIILLYDSNHKDVIADVTRTSVNAIQLEFDEAPGSNKYTCVVMTSMSQSGADGKSAYEAAVEGGYAGTEAQFNSDLSKISDKYEKPSTGIPETDLAGAVQDKLNEAERVNNKVTSMSASSTDTQYPSAKAVYDALAGKQDTLTFDAAPTAGSTNPVTSGGIKSAIDNQATFTMQIHYTDGTTKTATIKGTVS